MSTRLTVVPEHVCVQEHTYTGVGVLCAVSSPSPRGTGREEVTVW